MCETVGRSGPGATIKGIRADTGASVKLVVHTVTRRRDTGRKAKARIDAIAAEQAEPD